MTYRGLFVQIGQAGTFEIDSNSSSSFVTTLLSLSMGDSGKLIGMNGNDDLRCLHGSVSEPLGDEVSDVTDDLDVAGELVVTMLGDGQAIFDLKLSF